MVLVLSNTSRNIFYIDLLRCAAALAVVAIHTLGPLRHLYGEVSLDQWLVAAEINSILRWAVPVFIMITGVLLLSDQRPFNLHNYLTKRFLKVVIPFLAWTLIYAVIGGLSINGWASDTTVNLLKNANNDPTWYHLWFFYNFIPLYFIIPFLAPLLFKLNQEHIKLIIFAWLLLTLIHWLKVKTPLRESIILYSGYLILGWYLANLPIKNYRYIIIGGCIAIMINLIGTWYWSELKGDYSSTFMSYKTLNTVLISGMIFVLCKQYSDKVSSSLKPYITTVAKHTLGIYLIHPIFLIQVRNLDNGIYSLFGHNALAIPALTILVFLASYFSVKLLEKNKLTCWLVP